MAIIGGFFFLKWQPRQKSSARFLNYTISFNSRANGLGILREIFLLGDYAFKPSSPAPKILDVGANIGIATLFFKRYFPEADITAFEAMPENFKVLQENISQNKLQKTQAVLGFLGKENGTRDVYYNPVRPGGSTGVEAVAASKSEKQTFKKVQVPAFKLSDYLNEEIDLLKMDVEGAEGEILKEVHTSQKLRRIKEMVFEYHANRTNKENDLCDILKILEANNYSVVIYDNENGAFGKALKPFPIYHFMVRAFRRDHLAA